MLIIWGELFWTELQVKILQLCNSIYNKQKRKWGMSSLSKSVEPCLNKKMNFLIDHRNKSQNRDKKIIRCNLNQQYTNNLDEILDGTAGLGSSIKKKKKKKMWIPLRSSSTNWNISRVDSYILSLKNQKFTPIKLNKDSFRDRRATNIDSISHPPHFDQIKRREAIRPMSTMSWEEIPKCSRKESFNKMSIFENTESTTWDLISTKVSFNNLFCDFATPLKNQFTIEKEDFSNDKYITPIKKISTLWSRDNGSWKLIPAPMMIQSLNSSMISIHDTEKKPTRRLSIVQQPIYEKSIFRTWKKTKSKIRKKIKSKSKIKTEIREIDICKVQPKRLNIRNKELHIESQPYIDVKGGQEMKHKPPENYLCNSNEKYIHSLPYSTSEQQYMVSTRDVLIAL